MRQCTVIDCTKTTTFRCYGECEGSSQITKRFPRAFNGALDEKNPLKTPIQATSGISKHHNPWTARRTPYRIGLVAVKKSLSNKNI